MKSIAKMIGLGMVGFLVMVLILNRIDSDLTAETKAFLNQPQASVPPSFVAAFKYASAIDVPEGIDPAAKGEEKYRRASQAERPEIDPNPEPRLTWDTPKNSCQRGEYCTHTQMKDERAGMERHIQANGIALKRYNHLLDFGGMGLDLKPVMGFRNRIISQLNYCRLKVAHLNLRWEDGHYKEVLSELTRMNQFHAASLNHPATLLEEAIFLANYGMGRDFLLKAVQDTPAAKEILAGADLQSFRPSVSIDEIVSKTMWTELNLVADILEYPFDMGYFQMSDFSGTSLSSRIGRLYAWIAPAFFRKNETLNLYADWTMKIQSPECRKPDGNCPGEEEFSPYSLINPVGKMIVQMMTRSVREHIHKMNERLKMLHEPIAI